MAFIPNSSFILPTKTTHITCCAAKPAHSTSKHPHFNKAHASSSPSSQPDVWDTLIDDHTSVEHILNPQHHSQSTIQCAQARMAPRSSDPPKPQFASEPQPHPLPKKKRGRPKGSKSSNTSPTLPPQVSPFMAAVREDLRRRNIVANRDLVSGILDPQLGQSINSDQLQLVAPNGLPDHDNTNTDLLQELLPILAQQEADENRISTEEEVRMKQLISTCYTQFSSIHRFSDRLNNLKPFKLKAETEHDCQACDGTGMTVCEYCKGEGYVDLGENAEKFNPKFRNNEFTMPKRVTGNIYHCPLCGGLQKERCISCFGTGTITDREEFLAGASKASKDDRAWKIFDMDELMRQEADRIEVGLDGTIIMRAKPRGRRKKNKPAHENEKSPVSRTRRGHPSKNIREDVTTVKQKDDAAQTPNVVGHEADADPTLIATPGTVGIPRGRPLTRTTDFVNTTDYQVGRRLQRQSPTVGPSIPDSSEFSNSASQQNLDEVEEPGDLHG